MSELIDRQSLLKKQRIIIDDDGNMYKAVLVVDIENAPSVQLPLFENRREKRDVSETMDDLLSSVIRYLDEQTAEEVKTGLRLLRQIGVEGETYE